ncbi:helix-turn-helix transcriptional regulator [Cupriavidus gilardii]|uniref:helix-turn-helix transcriptional regulator n=1 Tax=Cupriavidus gilardii TaxID=82541 RepID=UPI001E2D44C1|nr:AraC family transcriptional regulator [Cupriavidus gilardii]
MSAVIVLVPVLRSAKSGIRSIILSGKEMIEMPVREAKHDRLAAFLRAFGLRAVAGADAGRGGTLARLYVMGDADDADGGIGVPTHLVFRASGGTPCHTDGAVLAAAAVDFGGATNPLVGALPDELVFPLAERPEMRGLAELFVAEVEDCRCGSPTVKDRLCEIIVVLAVRRAIAMGTVNAGLLAGLAHPRLHPCLVAMHDEPARQWRTDDLARIAGMSRSHFVAQFARTVGTTPADYLTSWRLAFGRAQLALGHSVKAVASRAGFGSAAAFSRAFSRQYGYAPVTVKASAQAD